MVWLSVCGFQLLLIARCCYSNRQPRGASSKESRSKRHTTNMQWKWMKKKVSGKKKKDWEQQRELLEKRSQKAFYLVSHLHQKLAAVFIHFTYIRRLCRRLSGETRSTSTISSPLHAFALPGSRASHTSFEHFKTRLEQTNSHLSVHKTGGFLNSNSQFSTILPSSLGYLNFVSEGIRQTTAFQLCEWIFEHFLMFFSSLLFKL